MISCSCIDPPSIDLNCAVSFFVFACLVSQTYGPQGLRYTARDCSVVMAHEKIRCVTSPGTGFGHKWRVVLGGQMSGFAGRYVCVVKGCRVTGGVSNDFTVRNDYFWLQWPFPPAPIASLMHVIRTGAARMLTFMGHLCDVCAARHTHLRW